MSFGVALIILVRKSSALLKWTLSVAINRFIAFSSAASSQAVNSNRLSDMLAAPGVDLVSSATA